jgi:hypothetical protein
VDAELFRRVGNALYGAEWQRPMSRALGPLHPDGPREAIDDRLVRRWSSGDRSIPDWVSRALIRVVDEHSGSLRAHAESLDVLADEIEQIAPEISSPDGPARAPS